MSQYEQYDVTSDSYDRTRQPVGLEVVLGALLLGPRPLAAQRVLELGCGTGNYLAAVADHVGASVGVDMSRGMLRQAAGKLEGRGRTGLLRVCLPELPFAAGAFDAVTCFQVVHHLPADDGFAALGTLLRQAARVLRPGGRLVLNTCTDPQLVDGYWYYAIFPEARDRVRARYAPVARLRELLDAAGFDEVREIAPLDAVLQGPAYSDPDGPRHQAWRHGDSGFALLEPPELEAGLARLRALRGKGWDAWMAERELRRQGVGQSSFFLGTLSPREP